MLPITANALAALTGSHTPYVRADVWYEGDIVAADIPVVGGQVEGVDDGDAIRKRLSLTVADDAGALIPRSEDAPLAPYGSRINIRAGIQTGREPETVSLGWFRIDTCSVDEAWRVYDRVDTVQWVSSGGDIEVTGPDLAEIIKDSRFLSPQQPAFTASIRDEVFFLLQGLPVQVGQWPGVTDTIIPSTITYTDDRWAAICDLATVMGAVPYMDPYGDLVMRSNADSASVWTVAADPDNGVLVSAPTRLTREGLYNAVRSAGNTVSDQVPIVVWQLEGSGPLRWDGPFVRVPYMHTSPLITTAEIAETDARTILARLVNRRSYPLTVECVTNYWLEVGDTVTVGTPYGDLDGRISQATWPLVPGAMTMTVVVPRESFWGAWGSEAELGT